MAQVKLLDSYYGMALSWLFRNKIQPALISAGEQKQIYEFTTNNSKKDFVLYLMYRKQSRNLKDEYSSWAFGDIRDNISELEDYAGQGKNPVLALICVKDDLKDSEIGFLFQKDLEKIKGKSSVTLSRKKKEKYFRIRMGGKREDSLTIKCDPDFEKIDL
jgi:hypothetical protein